MGIKGFKHNSSGNKTKGGKIMSGSIGNRVLRKRKETLELALRERDRTVSRMTTKIHVLRNTTRYIIAKLEGAGEFADAEILRMAMRNLWR